MEKKRNKKESDNKVDVCMFTPLKCRAAPEATAPHTVLSFPPVSMCQWLSEGARLKLSFSCEGRGTTGSSQYSPPHSGSHLRRTQAWKWSQIQIIRSKTRWPLSYSEFTDFNTTTQSKVIQSLRKRGILN